MKSTRTIVAATALFLAAPLLAAAEGPLLFTLEAASAESYSRPHDIVLSPDI